MRGTRGGFDVVSLEAGIIPAHAGNTHRFADGISRHWDHPRACGEHQLSGLQLRGLQGSSPRMRGTLGVEIDCDAERGIIPAHAGNTEPS